MKLENIGSKSTSGSVLATTLLITSVLGVTLVSFLLLAQHQMFANARSQSWNHSVAVTEAGVEDALQMINKFSYDSEKLLDWSTAPSLQEDSWHDAGTNSMFYSVRWLGDDNKSACVVFLDNKNPSAPIITSYGYRRYDHDYRNAPVTTATAGTTFEGFQSEYLQRHLQITTRRDALWALGMLADDEIDLNGNVVTTDSFNSADASKSDWNWTAHATYGLYDISKRRDQGDIATNSRLIDSLNVGNAKVRGHVSTGPGGTSYLGPIASVGTDAWVSAGNTGIQPGRSSDDMNVLLNDVALPTTTWFGLPTISDKGTNIDGTLYKHVILSDGDYQAPTLLGSVYVGAGVNARLYIAHDVSLTGNEEIRIDVNAEGLSMYMGGGKFRLGGNGIVNETGRAESFQYYGLSTNTELGFLGNGDFTGAIYAPHADFTLGGGGSTINDFIGASVTRSVKMNGSYNFHYDEDLATFGPSRGFVPTSWTEI